VRPDRRAGRRASAGDARGYPADRPNGRAGRFGHSRRTAGRFVSHRDGGRSVASRGTGTLRIIETPQFFRAELLRKAYACAYDPAFTDDATVVEAAGGVLRLVEGETTNLKITTRDDLAVAEAILARRTEA